MKNIKIILLLLITSFQAANFSAYAQTKIEGSLIDKTDKTALAYANIALLKQVDSTFLTGTTTDDLGKFTLIVPDSGKFLLRISYLGYGTQMQAIEVSKDEKTKKIGEIKIDKAGQLLQEVQIIAQKPIYSFEGEKKIYNTSDDISIQDGVATDALQNAPGVYVDEEGNVTLRGVSGVEIWLNNKPSRIKAEGLKSFLQQLPANSIEKIEVITNPSARYGAEGKGGIINIITNKKIKRNQLLSFGINGNSNNTYSPWLSYVVGNEKLNFNTYLSYNTFKHETESSSTDITMNENGDTIYKSNSTSSSTTKGAGYYGHVSLTWSINDNNTFDAWIGGGNYSSDNDFFSTQHRTTYLPTANILDYKYSGINSSSSSYLYSGISLEHKFKKEGHKLTLDGGLMNNSSSSDNLNNREYEVQTWQNYRYQNPNNTNSNGYYSLSILYENPLAKRRNIEAGSELTYGKDIAHSPTDTFNFATQEYLHVPLFSNESNKKHFSANAFITYSDTLWIINYKIGARYEHNQMGINSIALPNILRRYYNSIFPTIHLNTKTKNNGNFSLSYSRRIEYPTYYLDPFENRVNKESVSFGNPYLKPNYTNSYEFSYGHFFNKGHSITASIYHKQTKLAITNFNDMVFDTIMNDYLYSSTFVNAGDNNFTGADFSFSWIPAKNYRIMFNFNAYKQTFKADFEKYSVNTDDFTYDARLIFNMNYKFLRLNVTGNYQAPKKTFQGSKKACFSANATINADLFKKKLSLRLGMRDIFNTLNDNSDIFTPTIISTSKMKFRSQIVNFGVTFRFGKIEMEAHQRPAINGSM